MKNYRVRLVFFTIYYLLFTIYTSYTSSYAYAVNIDDVFDPAKRFKTFGDLLNTLLPNALLIAGLILFILILGAGFMILKGAGAGDAQAAEKGQKAVTYAVIGFTIIFVAYFVIQLIEFLTGIDIFNPGF